VLPDVDFSVIDQLQGCINGLMRGQGVLDFTAAIEFLQGENRNIESPAGRFAYLIGKHKDFTNIITGTFQKTLPVKSGKFTFRIMPAEHADEFIHPGKVRPDGILTAVTVRSIHDQVDLGPHHRPALPNDLAGRIFRFQAVLPTKTCRSGQGDNLKKSTSAYPCFLPLFLFHLVQSIFFGLRIIDYRKDLRKTLKPSGHKFSPTLARHLGALKKALQFKRIFKLIIDINYRFCQIPFT
jgi:hypothetical protein